MKKIIAILLVIVVAAGVGFVVYSRYTSIENQILGKWQGEYEISDLEFKKDGVVTLSVFSVSTDGTYTIDKENMKLSLTYTVVGISYTRDYNISLEEDVLKLTDSSLTNITLEYNRVTEQ